MMNLTQFKRHLDGLKVMYEEYLGGIILGDGGIDIVKTSDDSIFAIYAKCGAMRMTVNVQIMWDITVIKESDTDFVIIVFDCLGRTMAKWELSNSIYVEE